MTTSRSIMNVNINDDICISKNSCDIGKYDKPNRNSTFCDTNINDVFKDVVNMHEDATIVDQSKNLACNNNNVINGKS